MDEKGIQRLVAYAIAGAGFHNIEPIIQKLKVDEKMQLSRLFRRWLDGRSYEAFFQTLFEKFGYRCKDLFEKCFYAKHPINCCDIFEQAYVMLRGRCFRLKKFYQNDPDQYGKLLLTMKQLRSWFIDKSGQQPQIVIYVVDPGGEPAYFPRYYFNLREWNQLIIKKRHIKMLDTNEQCHTRCKHCSKSECYIKTWLTQRLLDPLNCTVYYEQHHSRGYRICNPWEIVSRYMDIVDVSVNGTKCLPACDREDYFVKLVSSDGIAINDNKKWNPLFRIDAYYSDLEVEKYEEVVTTTVPGFVSELGGQSNLILGFSIVTAIQSIRIIGLSLLKKMRRALCNMRPCSMCKVKDV
ncbi:Protein DEL-7 [Aphelenchoides avenae]|nr:Protein DEL-7 [Aphelenchus avenae]